MPSTSTTATIEQVELKPSQLVPHKKNIRAHVGDVSDLADSVRAKGVLQPLVVVPNGQPDKYVIVAGHRRHAAAKLAKVKTIPCVIRHDLTEEADQIAVMMVENGQRTDLTAVEEAKGVQTLLELGDTQKRITERTGMSAAKVRVRAKVAKLPEEITTKLTEHAVTLDDAAFIADHADNPVDLAELEKALGTNNWAVAKQQQVDRDAERKRRAGIRKAAEAAGIQVVTGWDARRELNAAAPKTLGTTAQQMVRKEYTWPPAQVVLEDAQSPDTVAYLHISESRSLMVGSKMVSESLVVLSAPVESGTVSPSQSSESGPASEPEGGRSGEAQQAEDEPPTALSAEQVAAQEHDANVSAATKVRRQFVSSLVVAGDREVASRFGTFTARALSDLSGEGLDEEAFPHVDLAGFLPIEVDSDPSQPIITRRGSAVREAVFMWLSGQTNPCSSLMAWTLHFLAPLDQWVLQTEPHEHDAKSLTLLLDYIALLADLGHVLSDVEIAARDAFQGVLAEESGDEE